MARRSRAKYYLGEPLWGRPWYHTMRWYDKKMRRIQSSVEVLINTEYVLEDEIYLYQKGL
jgi:hypothetical protein